MKYFKKIEGERIYLSPITMDDNEIFVKWLNDRQVTDGTNITSKINNIESEKSWINKVLENNEYIFAIVLKENDKLIGNCSITNINHIHRIATLGILIGEEEYRNNGYGREALSLLLEYGFNILNFHNIKLDVFSFNKRAINCYKKVGFKECGKRHECYFLEGKYHDSIEMEILEKDYRNKKLDK